MKSKVKIGGFRAKIWNACGADHIRPVLSYAHVKDGYIYATNAHILIKQKLTAVHGIDEEQASHLEGKFLHRELLKELDRYDVVQFEKDSIYATKSGVETRFKYSFFDGVFPNCDAVIPSTDKIEAVENIGVNHAILKELTSAMYKNDIPKHRLTFHGSNRGIIVTNEELSRDEELGIIMPVMLNN